MKQSTVPISANASKKPISYDGKEYPSRKSLADSFGIPYYTFMQRLHRGWSLEKAVNYSENLIHFTKEELEVIHLVTSFSMGSLFSCISSNGKIMEGIIKKIEAGGFYGVVHGVIKDENVQQAEKEKAQAGKVDNSQ